MITTLVENGFQLALYGPWKGSANSLGSERGVPSLEHLHKGVVSYKDMPSVYASSRINLNSHVRPSSFGYLNERVITCLASGGFLLTDRVAGLEHSFAIGTHLEAWSDLDELTSKCRYYLEHSDKRKQIAEAGREYTLKHFSVAQFVKTMLASLR